MKKKIFYVNDGLDGIILARGKEHAISILSKVYSVPKSWIRQYQKGKPASITIWEFEESQTKKKGRSRIIGFLEW